MAGMTEAPRQMGPYPVRRIGFADLRHALMEGAGDLAAAPAYGLTIGAFYAGGGLFLLAMVFRLNLAYLAYPLAAGFLLVGPFAALLLYEVSRRREAGLPIGWSALWRVAVREGAGRLGWMPILTLFAFIVWLDVAVVIYAVFFGLRAQPLPDLALAILTTADGLLFLVVGHAVGAVFAGTIYSASVVGYPLLLARGCDFVTAIATSLRAVAANPAPMLAYAGIVAGATAFAIVPAFLGLVVVLPWLGHATWHLHRCLIGPDDADL